MKTELLSVGVVVGQPAAAQCVAGSNLARTRVIRENKRVKKRRSEEEKHNKSTDDDYSC